MLSRQKKKYVPKEKTMGACWKDKEPTWRPYLEQSEQQNNDSIIL